MRVRIAATVSSGVREVERGILEEWLDLRGGGFEKFVGEVCGWKVSGEVVEVPWNKDNEAKGTVVRENVKFDREPPFFSSFFPSGSGGTKREWVESVRSRALGCAYGHGRNDDVND